MFGRRRRNGLNFGRNRRNINVEKIKEVKKEPLEISGFNTVIKSNVNNVQISANAEYVPYQNLNFTFTAPETVKDMQILCSNGEYTVNMNKISFTFYLL